MCVFFKQKKMTEAIFYIFVSTRGVVDIVCDITFKSRNSTILSSNYSS